jgi:hypothetical protein
MSVIPTVECLEFWRAVTIGAAIHECSFVFQGKARTDLRDCVGVGSHCSLADAVPAQAENPRKVSSWHLADKTAVLDIVRSSG